MLKVPTEFPQVGSYALLVDDTLPITQQRAELVRVLELGVSAALIAFPLRLGATGQQRVVLADLIDGTELTCVEQRELTDLLNYCRDRLRPSKAKMERAEALRCRLIHSDLLRAELAKLARLQARGQPSTGSYLPKEYAA